jgi:hypothetical protein
MPQPFRAVYTYIFALLPVSAMLLATAPVVRAASAEPGASSLEFIQNKGQWDSRVRYEAALPAGRLLCRPTP